ncbi:protein of unknown function DUF29 [Stanieria cyanosphaera PCC 7437]|uniref:DUF29 family protein n=1 Tax=Stanieria cyanosphaera (strain ATCC 29371 / PCC 7437) TaxID=111780 RepID=K9XNE4_STAC7|nr:DUF29 family protein [Stanieria cyanosphaera]AFZ34125.1 protein of unknown function DUF29 [Stanieria cyanosphaera PCC 7437]
MEEILELKECLLNRQYERAMTIVEELELMGRQDKINNLESFLVILLIHLIKIQVEKRVTRSWRSSIVNSFREIQKRNRLGNRSHYIKPNQWNEHFKAIYADAIFKAADETFGGIEITELKSLVDFNSLQNLALELLDLIYTLDADSIINLICDRFPIGSLE